METSKKVHIERAYSIKDLVEPGKVLVVYGPRRAGKTTLVQEYVATLAPKTFLFETGDNIVVQELLGSGDMSRILARVQDVFVYVIDEAQNVPNIGMALKIMVDARPDLVVVATGSSSFDLANKIGEPLVGRRRVITLYPFSLRELAALTSSAQLDDTLANVLTYGLYPQVYTANSEYKKVDVLGEIVGGYLLKDIFTLEDIQAPSQLLHLVKLLAQYIGQPISVTKLANEVNLNQDTVERYLYLLEKTFVIYKLMPFSEKLSQSLKFKPKYYFYDVGIRNALIGSFLPPHQRTDIGALWENFCVMERVKRNAYARESHPQYYFYQSYHTKKEIDLIEQYNGHAAYECKWSSNVGTLALADWDLAYPDAPVRVISKETYRTYLV